MILFALKPIFVIIRFEMMAHHIRILNKKQLYLNENPAQQENGLVNRLRIANRFIQIASFAVSVAFFL